MREVKTVVDSDNFVVDEVDGQTTNDYIHLFRWIDRTPFLRDKTFNLKRVIGGRSELSLTFNIPVQNPVNDYLPLWVPKDGQFIKVYYNDAILFYGTITKINKKLTSDAYQKAYLICNASCNGLNILANRRHIKVKYKDGVNVSTIVSYIASILTSDGIKPGIINNGINLADDWVDQCSSAYELLDACAEKSGFQWFIDDYGYLQLVS